MEQELNQRVITDLGTLRLQVIDLEVRLKYTLKELEALREQVKRAETPDETVS